MCPAADVHGAGGGEGVSEDAVMKGARVHCHFWRSLSIWQSSRDELALGSECVTARVDASAPLAVVLSSIAVFPCVNCWKVL